MALKIFQPGIQPAGQFDVLDGYLDSILGGEVGTLYEASRVNTASEKAAADALDGYTNVSAVTRAAVANRVNTSTQRPLFLLDEGKAGYGTLFGQVIGTPAGLSTTGTNLGPHTAAASGKVTCWHQPGMYGVSVDAVNTAADGLVLTNASCVPGLELHVLNNGKLTPAGSTGAVAVEVARFVEFETSPFLVNTPASAVGADEAAVNAVIHFKVEA
jgi:hypothetical protein